MTTALDKAFRPDHYNYAFLQNQDRHVHLHVFPRYASARRIGGAEFTDADYPDHDRVPSPMRTVDAGVRRSPRKPLCSPLNGHRLACHRPGSDPRTRSLTLSTSAV